MFRDRGFSLVELVIATGLSGSGSDTCGTTNHCTALPSKDSGMVSDSSLCGPNG